MKAISETLKRDIATSNARIAAEFASARQRPQSEANRKTKKEEKTDEQEIQ